MRAREIERVEDGKHSLEHRGRSPLGQFLSLTRHALSVVFELGLKASKIVKVLVSLAERVGQWICLLYEDRFETSVEVIGLVRSRLVLRIGWILRSICNGLIGRLNGIF